VNKGIAAGRFDHPQRLSRTRGLTIQETDPRALAGEYAGNGFASADASTL
jgi:hypothetical protein